MTQDSNLLSIDLTETRCGDETTWRLPPWGHPLSQCVMPLLISAEDHLFPIGTAFIISRRVVFVATAEHNIREAMKRCWRNQRLASRDDLTGSLALSAGVGVWLLYQHLQPSGAMDLILWPLERVHGPQPSDIIIGFPKASALATVSCNLSFEIPDPGTIIHCVGYSGFSFPEDGISLSALREGSFDWENDYSHEFLVVEGSVRFFFTQRFTRGYVRGPCFLIDAAIPHGLSGGPAFNQDGSICGVNSASALSFFNEPSSLISPLFPILTTQIKFGFSLGNMRMNSTQSIADFVARDSIRARGTEATVHVAPDPAGGHRVGTMTKVEPQGWVFDDFEGYQAGRKPLLEAGPVYVMRRNSEDGAV